MCNPKDSHIIAWKLLLSQMEINKHVFPDPLVEYCFLEATGASAYMRGRVHAPVCVCMGACMCAHACARVVSSLAPRAPGEPTCSQSIPSAQASEDGPGSTHSRSS